ncbi:MAG: SIR2 family protein [Pseudonocardiaceae bacterium]
MTLSLTLRAMPRSYAVLLGAGVSVAAGIPTTQDVQDALIRKVALVHGERPVDPVDWYRRRHDRPPSYGDLVASLAHTPIQRQALLREFFESATGAPTAAHRALARLVAADQVRVVLTMNFDRLLESALAEVGIEPTVVSGRTDLAGLAPLHTLRCLVVHLHGDYLTASSMLNTPEELLAYPPDLDALLDRVFDDHGLIIAGWSARWDPALRAALARRAGRRFVTYWVDPFPLGDAAEGLRERLGAVTVRVEADAFFSDLAAAGRALAEPNSPFRTPLVDAVAFAKRELTRSGPAVALHDTLRGECDRLGTLAAAEVPTAVEAAAATLLDLTATVAYWGGPDTDRWWFGDLVRLAGAEPPGGRRALATMMLHAAGVAAVGAERWSLLARLLRGPREPESRTDGRVWPRLYPAETFGCRKAGSRLYHLLRPVFAERLAWGESAYVDAWERFEYLWLVCHGPAGPGVPHPRFVERHSGLIPTPSDWLAEEIAQSGPGFRAIVDGVFAGDPVALRLAKARCDDWFGGTVRDAAPPTAPRTVLIGAADLRARPRP